MAVYTSLTHTDIEAFLAHYALGALRSFEGIAEGVENSNFCVETTQGKYILTLFEKRVKPEDLPYYLTLMEWLSARGIDCPQPVRAQNGRMLGVVKEKPAALVTFLEGKGAEPIRQEHLPLLGSLAARMHLAGMDFPHRRDNALALGGWEALAETIGGRADEIHPGLSGVIGEELYFLREHWPSGLPGGAVHADLFPDNVFFTPAQPSPFQGEGKGGGRLALSGVIDFYFACTEAWAYDLAICINAWCFDARQRFLPERVAAMMQAYTDLRSFTPEEEAAFPVLLRGAALRFLLTRTHDWIFHPPGALVQRKDPLEYLAKLEYFQRHSIV